MTIGVVIIILLFFIGYKLEQMHKYRIERDIDKEMEENETIGEHRARMEEEGLES